MNRTTGGTVADGADVGVAGRGEGGATARAVAGLSVELAGGVEEAGNGEAVAAAKSVAAAKGVRAAGLPVAGPAVAAWVAGVEMVVEAVGLQAARANTAMAISSLDAGPPQTGL